MASFVPFRAIRYAATSSEALSRLVAPPYDVLSPSDQAALYERDSHNIVRVILSRPEPNDPDENAPYSRAAECLQGWLRDGVLVEDREPSLTVYRQEFRHPVTGSRLSRTSLIGALGLRPYADGVVLPHEQTRPKAKQDRLQLMRATRANTEPIYLLYEDVERELAGRLASLTEQMRPLAVAEDGGDTHVVWRVTDREFVEWTARFFEPRRVWIADGHHRYETALSYREEAGAGGADFVLAALSAFNDPGLLVLPTHRLVRGLSEERIADLPKRLLDYFSVQETTVSELPARMRDTAERASFGLVTPQGCRLLVLKDRAAMDRLASDRGTAWRRLDVSVLQTLVLDPCLGLPADSLPSSPHIGYARNQDEALGLVRSGEWQAALLMNDPAADEVREVAAEGEKMPAKSTFFYPKLWSGLVLRRLDPGGP